MKIEKFFLWLLLAMYLLFLLLISSSCCFKRQYSPSKRVFVVTAIKDDVMILNYRYRTHKCDTCKVGDKIISYLIY